MSGLFEDHAKPTKLDFIPDSDSAKTLFFEQFSG